MAVPPDAFDYVVDASALAKLFLEEPESRAFRSWYVEEVRRGATFAAPSLLGYEIAHLMAKNLDPPKDAEEAPRWFTGLHARVLEGIHLDQQAARRAYPWTARLTGYDASYLAVCATGRGQLVSYDGALVREASRCGIEARSPK